MMLGLSVKSRKLSMALLETGVGVFIASLIVQRSMPTKLMTGVLIVSWLVYVMGLVSGFRSGSSRLLFVGGYYAVLIAVFSSLAWRIVMHG